MTMPSIPDEADEFFLFEPGVTEDEAEARMCARSANMKKSKSHPVPPPNQRGRQVLPPGNAKPPPSPSTPTSNQEDPSMLASSSQEHHRALQPRRSPMAAASPTQSPSSTVDSAIPQSEKHRSSRPSSEKLPPLNKKEKKGKSSKKEKKDKEGRRRRSDSVGRRSHSVGRRRRADSTDSNTIPSSVSSDTPSVSNQTKAPPYYETYYENSKLRVKSQRDSLLKRGLSTAETKKRSVRFDTAEFREFPMILGDNPAVAEGPPITIGWAFNPQTHFVLHVDAFEKARGGTRRHFTNLKMSKELREKHLLNSGVTQKEIVAAIRQIRKDQASRQAASQVQPNVESMHKAVENARVGFKKILNRNKKSSYEKRLAAACNADEMGDSGISNEQHAAVPVHTI